MSVDWTIINERLPDFKSHEEARACFKEKFEDRFLLRSVDVIEGKRVYFYHLIKDLDEYQEYMESLISSVKQETTTVKPFESYSTVEINEDGVISFSI